MASSADALSSALRSGGLSVFRSPRGSSLLPRNGRPGQVASARHLGAHSLPGCRCGTCLSASESLPMYRASQSSTSPVADTAPATSAVAGDAVADVSQSPSTAVVVDVTGPAVSPSQSLTWSADALRGYATHLAQLQVASRFADGAKFRAEVKQAVAALRVARRHIATATANEVVVGTRETPWRNGVVQVQYELERDALAVGGLDNDSFEAHTPEARNPLLFDWTFAASVVAELLSDVPRQMSAVRRAAVLAGSKAVSHE